MLKQPQEIITTHLNKNIICNIVTEKLTRDTVNNDEGDNSSLQTNDMPNVELVTDNVEISETVDKSMNNNNNMPKEQSNKPTLDSVINESEASRKNNITPSNNNKSLLNYHETDYNNKDDFTSNYLIINSIGMLNYRKKELNKIAKPNHWLEKMILWFRLT